MSGEKIANTMQQIFRKCLNTIFSIHIIFLFNKGKAYCPTFYPLASACFTFHILDNNI